MPDEIDNAGKASKLLDRLSKRRQENLTTPKQIRFLEGKGFQHVGTWQFEAAKKTDRPHCREWLAGATYDRPVQLCSGTGVVTYDRDKNRFKGNH